MSSVAVQCIALWSIILYITLCILNIFLFDWSNGFIITQWWKIFHPAFSQYTIRSPASFEYCPQLCLRLYKTIGTTLRIDLKPSRFLSTFQTSTYTEWYPIITQTAINKVFFPYSLVLSNSVTHCLSLIAIQPISMSFNVVPYCHRLSKLERSPKWPSATSTQLGM